MPLRSLLRLGASAWLSVLLLAQPAPALAQWEKEAAPAALQLQPWLPDETVPPTLVYQDGLFNHQPVVVHDLDGAFLVLWTGNADSTAEGARGQRIYASRSTDGGRTWSPRFLPLGLPGGATDPRATGTEWQPRAARVQRRDGPEVWIAYNIGRGQPAQGALLAIRRGAGAPLALHRIVQDQRDGQIRVVDATEAARDGSRFSPLWRIGDHLWFPFPQSIRQLPDGTVLMSLTLIEGRTPFATAPKRFAVLRIDGDRATLSPAAGPGDMGETDAWESALYLRRDGRLTALIRSNDTRRPRGRRLAYSESADGGRTWSDARWTLMPIHTEQPSLVQRDLGDAVLVMPDHALHRNNQALMVLNGQQLTPGLGVSTETDGREFAHTSDLAWDASARHLLVVWSESRVGETPRSIHFRRVEPFQEPGGLLLLPRRNAAFEHDAGREQARWDAGQHRLSLEGAASAGLQLPEQAAALELTVDLRGVPDTATLATAGNTEHRLRWRYIASEGLIRVEQLDGSGNTRLEPQLLTRIEVPADRKSAFPLQIGWHPQTRRLRMGPDQSWPLAPGFFSFFLGDGFLDEARGSRSRLVFQLPGPVGERCARSASDKASARCVALGLAAP